MPEAQARFEAAQAEHQRQEAERRRALAIAKAKYDRKVTEERAKAAARNAYVTSRQSAFAAGDPEAVQWFVGCVLRVSPYPDGFPREYQVSLRPGEPGRHGGSRAPAAQRGARGARATAT